MEGNSNWNLYEQSVVNNAYDWRSHHEPHLRNKAVSNLVIWLRNLFPYHSINQIESKALKIEEKIYGIAIDKDDYNRKILERIHMMKREAMDFHSGSSVNETNTLEPAAQVLNQGRQELLPQQQQLHQQEGNQQLQLPTSQETNEMNDVSMEQENNIEAGLFQQHLSSSNHQLQTPQASPAQLLNQQILGGSPFATSFAPSPVLDEDPEKTMFSVSQPQQVQTAAQSQEQTAAQSKDLKDTRRRSLTIHEEPNQPKRMKLSITSQTDDGYKHLSGLEPEGDSTATSGSEVNKTNVENK